MRESYLRFHEMRGTRPDTHMLETDVAMLRDAIARGQRALEDGGASLHLCAKLRHFESRALLSEQAAGAYEFYEWAEQIAALRRQLRTLGERIAGRGEITDSRRASLSTGAGSNYVHNIPAGRRRLNRLRAGRICA